MADALYNLGRNIFAQVFAEHSDEGIDDKNRLRSLSERVGRVADMFRGI